MALLRGILFSILFWIAAAAPVMAEKIELAEQKIKAGLLYNFLKYTDWPQTDPVETPITICLLGGDPFEGNLDPLEGRNVKQRSISIRKLNAVNDTNGCHLVFLSVSEKKYWPDLRARLAGKNVLTVGDFPGFIHDGGMIEFGRKESRVNVTLNLQAVKTAHLQMQERMLRLVTVVSSDGER